MQNTITVFGSTLAKHRLLLLAYYFPPRPKGGAPRLGHLANNLAECGWEVTVVTPSEYPGEFRMRADGNSAAKGARSRQSSSGFVSWLKSVPGLKRLTLGIFKLLVLPRALLQFPDRTIWWLWPALRDARRLHKQQRFDAMFTSCAPGASHVIGAIVARLCGIPWIADYQDLWSQSVMSTKSASRREAERRLEAWALRGAAAITCCKESFVPKLQKFSKAEKPVAVVPMAVEMSLWDDVTDQDPTEFRLAFVGNMYAGHITPDLLFAALRELRQKNDPAGQDATFHYYGHCGAIVRSAAKRFGLGEIVFDHGLVPQRIALEAERAAALLVVIVNPDLLHAPNPQLWQPSKLFEYAGARRQILGIAPPHSTVEKFLGESGLGFFASEQAGIATALQTAHSLFLRGQFRPALNPDWKYVTPRDVGQGFATVLQGIVGELSPPRAVLDLANRPDSSFLPARDAEHPSPLQRSAHEAART